MLKGIGSFKAIKPVSIQVPLTAEEKPKTFDFSRQWTVPRLVLNLSSGRMPLTTITFLVADDDLACEDILIGLPVLEHMEIDSRTMLERNRAVLDGTDCANIGNPSAFGASGVLGRLILSREERTYGDQTASAGAEPPDPDRPRQDYFANQQDDDPFPDPDLIGVDHGTAEAEIEDATTAMLQRSKDHGLPKDIWQPMEYLVREHTKTFSQSFSAEPEKVPRLEIELMPDACPVRVKLRSYSAPQKAFMSKLTKELEVKGLIYPNPSSKWACAPLIVPKKGPEEWRFTVDYHLVNSYTYPFAFPMSNVEQELTKTARSKFYAILDFIHSYWQLPLALRSQECQSFITHENVFTPRRVLHGTTNAVLHLQSFMTTNLPHDLKEKVLMWVDDILLHDEPERAIVDNLKRFFMFCDEFNIKLHPCKCTLFATSAKWCGRIISAAGVRQDPAGIVGLTSMDPPSTGGQLQKFLCAMQWLRSAIPQFQTLVQPLHDFLETVYKK